MGGSVQDADQIGETYRESFRVVSAHRAFTARLFCVQQRLDSRRLEFLYDLPSSHVE
jgi:hypothetical protein